ncbi:hypothetical protein EDB19DRAFT_1897950 [Suillus lakei]|nr:hypothetical protein EDB19DRAFT_1897950 [Suillus lakei]
MHYDYGNDAIDDNMAPGFETVEFLYKKVQMSAGDINKLMHLWGLDHWDLYSTIDETPIGDVAWQSFSMKYGVDADPASDLTPWMDTTYTTWFRDPHTIIRSTLGNPNFKNEMDYVPYCEWKGQGESTTRQWRNVMSGNWAWDQADEIAKDPAMHGSTFVPVILRSDKTTVSVATGQNDYYPLYASIGNVHNNIRHAHCNAVAVIGFWPFQKVSTKKHSDDPHFRKFKKQLFHSLLSRILSSLKPAMSVPKVVQFGDGHFRRVVYGLGPYIADYPEQLVLGCVVQNWCAKCFAYPDDLDSGEGGLRSREVVDTLCDEVDSGVLWEEWGVISDVVPFTNDFPHADIHQLLTLDILHQVIKGAFKDHLVAWVEKHMRRRFWMILIIAPPFAGLRLFLQGRGFSQWTGDDSKALMKVYLPAIEGHVLQDIIQCFRAFLEFCYIHTLCHYSMLIHLFGAPNGICSSITESKHIKAIKEPWQRSSKFNALGQMLLTNQHLDKLAASHSDFTAHRMLDDSFISDHLAYLDQLESATAQNDEAMQVDAPDNNTSSSSSSNNRSGHSSSNNSNGRSSNSSSNNNNLNSHRPRAQCDVKLACTHSDELHVPDLLRLVRLFLFNQLLVDNVHTSDNVSLSACPRFEGHIKIFNSATASFYAPSDLSSVGGMQHKHICAAPSWRRGPAHNNTVLVNTTSEDGIDGMDHSRETFPCALVHWFKLIANEPNPDTGMWMLSIIHVDTIIRACHLLPIFDSDFAPDN